MVSPPHIGAKAAEGEVHVAQTEAPEFEKVHWTKEPHLRKLYAYGAVLMIASATTGYDGSLINTSQLMNQWLDFFPEVASSNKLGILVNMFNIGSIVSFLLTPYLADTYGRKIAIAIGCVIMVIGGCINAFTTNYGMFLAGRFLLGFGNSFAQMSSPLLLTEICHPQHRGPVTTIYNTLWNLGSVIETSIGWGTSHVRGNWSWRSITFIQIFPSIIQLIFIYWIPESPRYLVSRDRPEEALDILATYHAGGDRDNATVQYEYREIKETMRLEKEATRATSYADFFRTKGNRWRLAIVVSLGVISQYSGNTIFSNYIGIVYTAAGITDQNQKLALSTGQTILNLIVTILAALSVDKVGRRPLFLIALCGMCASCIFWTVSGAMYENSDQTNSGAGYAQVVSVWIFGIFYDIGWSGLLVAYCVEILPFHLRAKGMMIMNITIQAVLAIANQTNLPGWNNLPHHWNFMLFITCWDFVELVFVYFVYVETKGPTLEQVSRIFDGEDAVAHINLDQVQKEIYLHATQPEENAEGTTNKV